MSEAIPADARNLARFRHALRKILCSSDTEARKVGLTPQQHQLLLGVAGFTGRGWATVSELAEFLQLRHHSVVGLIDRTQENGLVRRTTNPDNKREVRVMLTAEGVRKLQVLASHHRKVLNALRRSSDLFRLEEAGQVRAQPIRKELASAPLRKRA